MMRHAAWGAVVWMVCVGGLRADEAPAAAPPAPPVVYGDLAPIVAEPKAPLLLHLKIEADGRLGLRSQRPGPTAAWRDLGTWSLAGEPAQAMAALRGLHAALAAAHAVRPGEASVREADGHSAARLVVEAAPAALWRYVQWVLATGCAPAHKVYRVTFVGAPDAPRIDVDLPKDRSGPGPEPAEGQGATRISLTFFRKDVVPPGGGPPTDAFTRLRLALAWDAGWPGIIEIVEEIPGEVGSEGPVPKPAPAPAPRPRPKVLDGGEAPGGSPSPKVLDGNSPPGGSPPPAAPAPAAPAAPADGSLTFDLPASHASATEHEAAHQRLSALLASALSRARGTRVAEFRVPPPTGVRVPVGDVLRVMGLLWARGVTELELEGAPPPLSRKDGGGWDFSVPR